MFVVDDSPTFKHTVEVMVPCDLGHEKQSLSVTYRVLPVTESEAHDTSTIAGSTEWLRAVVVKLDDLVNANKSPLPYNETVRDKLFDLPFVRVALTMGYYAAINKGAAGN